MLADGLAEGSSIQLPNIVYVVRNPSMVNSEYMQKYLSLVGSSYFDRARALFDSYDNLSWKTNYKSKLEIDGQYENMIKIFARFPRSTSVCATFLLPKDLSRARAIQASVPCPLSLTFNLIASKVCMNVFFRCQDILSLALCDMLFLSKIQCKLIADTRQLNNQKISKYTLEQGSMTFFVSSGFIRKSDRGLAVALSNTLP